MESRLELQRLVRAESNPDSILVRFEPYLNRAVDYAIGEGLLKRDKGKRIELTAIGKQLAKELVELDGPYHIERQFMDALGQKVTENLVNSMFSRKG